MMNDPSPPGSPNQRINMSVCFSESSLTLLREGNVQYEKLRIYDVHGRPQEVDVIAIVANFLTLALRARAGEEASA